MSESPDLVPFLLARIAEDEDAARAAAPEGTPLTWSTATGWRTINDEAVSFEGYKGYVDTGDINYIQAEWNGEEATHPLAAARAAHVARWDPARVLAECEAKRAILAEHSRPQSDLFTHCEGCGVEYIGASYVTEDINECPMLRAVALAYRDHPDYQAEWSIK